MTENNLLFMINLPLGVKFVLSKDVEQILTDQLSCCWVYTAGGLHRVQGGHQFGHPLV